MGKYYVFRKNRKNIFAPENQEIKMSYLEGLLKVSLVSLQSREKIAFSSLCKDKPTVFYFIRRFGCSLCRWGAKDIARIIPIVSDRANVVAVAPEFLGHEEFTEGKYWPQDIYIDEKKECYKQIGFTRYNNFTVFGALIDKKVIAMNKQAKEEGITGNFKGDTLTKGGVLILSPEGKEVIYEFKQQSAGDHCPPSEILKALGIEEKIESSSGPSCNDDACTL